MPDFVFSSFLPFYKAIKRPAFFWESNIKQAAPSEMQSSCLMSWAPPLSRPPQTQLQLASAAALSADVTGPGDTNKLLARDWKQLNRTCTRSLLSATRVAAPPKKIGINAVNYVKNIPNVSVSQRSFRQTLWKKMTWQWFICLFSRNKLLFPVMSNNFKIEDQCWDSNVLTRSPFMCLPFLSCSPQLHVCSDNDWRHFSSITAIFGFF